MCGLPGRLDAAFYTATDNPYVLRSVIASQQCGLAAPLDDPAPGRHFCGVWFDFQPLETCSVQGAMPIPNNPLLNKDPSASCATPELKVAYAEAEIGPFLPWLDIGDRVLIHYRNGQTEKFGIICKFCSIHVQPIPGTCG